ncbi:MAG TPA: hypothetical protein VJI75_00415 [Candidatus Nanoarchaeia archaeon]|nr:hypothetical protein [Candidatus Nanoarchaeia archaeon]
MTKKCVICDEDADLAIKGTSDYYCRECAEQQFGDITVLVSAEDSAQQLKDKVNEIISQADELLEREGSRLSAEKGGAVIGGEDDDEEEEDDLSIIEGNRSPEVKRKRSSPKNSLKKPVKKGKK